MGSSLPWLRQVVTHLPAAVACTEGVAAPQLVFVNRQFVRLFGYELSDLVDLEDWLAHLCPDELERAELRTLWSLHEGVVASEFHAVFTTGEVRELRAQGEWFGDVLLLSFESRRAASTSSRPPIVRSSSSEAHVLAARLVRARHELISQLMRDLRGPLEEMVGVAELGSRCEDPARASEALWDIASSGRDLLVTLDELLDVG